MSFPEPAQDKSIMKEPMIAPVEPQKYPPTPPMNSAAKSEVDLGTQFQAQRELFATPTISTARD